MQRREVFIAGIAAIVFGCLMMVFFGDAKAETLPVDPAWLASVFVCIGLACFGYGYYFMKR